MSKDALETVIAIYRVQAAREDEFMGLLRKHYPILKKLGLVTNDPPVVYRGTEKGTDEPILFEIFHWIDAAAAQTAHEMPELMAVWEAMGTLVEERNGKPGFEFPHVEKLNLAFA